MSHQRSIPRVGPYGAMALIALLLAPTVALAGSPVPALEAEPGGSVIRHAASLSAGIAQGDNCSLQDIAPSASAMGRLEPSDCRVLDAYPELGFADPDAALDQFRVVLTERGRLSVSLSSSETDVALGLFDGNVRVGYLDDDLGELDASLSATAQVGEYRILVSSPSGLDGSYQLSLSFQPEPRPACEAEDLAPGDTLLRSLSADDCLFGDILPDDFFQHRVDIYSLSLFGRGRLTVDLSSVEIDPYLEIYDSDYGSWIEANSDLDAVNLDARLDLWLPIGEYRILASSDVAEELGEYFISAAFEAEAADCSPNALPLGVQQGGWLDPDLCRRFDVEGEGFGQEPVAVWDLSLPSQGQLSLDMRSDDPLNAVDPLLLLYDGVGRLLAEHDDIAPEAVYDAEIVMDLPAGDYRVLAASGNRLGGPYDLRADLVTAGGPGEPTPTPGTGSSLTIYMPLCLNE